MIERGSVSTGVFSFIQNLYKIGILKVECVVLRYEHFDAATVEQVQSAEKSPTTNVPSSQSGECFVLLYCVGVVLNKYKVENALGTRTRSVEGVRARNRSSKSEGRRSTPGWIYHVRFCEIRDYVWVWRCLARHYHPFSPLTSMSKQLKKCLTFSDASLLSNSSPVFKCGSTAALSMLLNKSFGIHTVEVGLLNGYSEFISSK